jgi:hypothetical protein
MINYDWLYIERPYEDVVYTKNPADKFVIDRVLNGEEACWEKEETCVQKHKGTLLICDPTAFYWDDKKGSRIKTILKELLEEGFRIFVWEKESPVSITNSKQFNQNNVDIFPCHPETMQQAMADLQVSPSELIFLDYFNINRLMGDKSYTRIYTYDFYTIPTFKLRGILRSLLQGKIKPTQIIDSFYICEHNKKIKFLKTFKKELPDLPLSVKINHFYTFSSESLPEDIDTLITNLTDEIKIYDSFESDRPTQRDFLKYLETSLVMNLKESISIQILKSALQLQTLSVDMNYQLSEKWFEENPYALSNLTEIKINCTVDGLSDFLVLLAKRASKLKSIKIESEDVISLEACIFDGFQELEEVSISAKEFTFESLLSLLKNTRNLKSLDLSINTFHFATSLSPLNIPNFSSLKKLILGKSEFLASYSFTDEMLCAILNNAPHLAYLELQNCNIKKKTSSNLLSNLALRNVEKIEITYTNIENAMFVFSQTTNLKNLTLIKIKSFECEIPTECFEKLEGLTCEEGAPHCFIYSALTGSRHLKSLILNNCEIDESKVLLSSMKFKSLETLKVSSQRSLLNLLYQLLSASPFLKTLDLSSQPIFTPNRYNFSDIPLFELEKLNYSAKYSRLDSRGMSSNLLVSFLNKKENLNELLLHSCRGADLLENIEPCNLRKLKTFSIKRCNFYTDVLWAILNKANDLESLDIINSKIYHADYPFQSSFNPLDVKLKKIKYLNLTDTSHFPHDLLLQLIEKSKEIKTIKFGKIKELEKHINELWFASHPEHFRHLEEVCIKLELTSEEFFRMLNKYTKLDRVGIIYSKKKRKEILEKSDWFNELFPNAKISWVNGIDEYYSKYETLEGYEGEDGDEYEGEDGDEYEGEHEHEHEVVDSEYKVPFSLNTQLRCDANTKADDRCFELTRIFHAKDGDHPHPCTYREATFNAIEINKAILNEHESPFLFYNTGDLEFVDCQVSWEKSQSDLLSKWQPYIEAAQQYYGIYQKKISNRWQALPSLSPQEKIVSLYSCDCEKDDVELKYSLRDNLYYVRYKKNSTPMIRFEFLVEVPSLKDHRAINLPAIQQLVNSLNYGAKESIHALKMDVSEPTGEDYLKAIKTQRQGSCRHRTVVFMDLLKENLYQNIPLRKRAVINSCHAYGEIYLEREWYRCNFGGHASRLVISEQASVPSFIVQTSNINIPLQAPIPEEKQLNPKFMTWLSHEKRNFTFSPEEWMSELFIKYEGKNILIEVQSKEENEAYRLFIQHTCQTQKKEVFYIDKPMDLICSAKWVKRLDSGCAQRMPGPGGVFYEFLTKTHFHSPVIVMNCDTFKAEDLVRVNSLFELDARFRMGDGINVPENASIVVLSDSSQPRCHGGDFYDRFHHSVKHTSEDSRIIVEKTKDLLMPVFPLEKASASINLHHSSDWQSILLGHWTLAGAYCVYKEGKLETLLKNGHTHIDFQNAPWDVREFRVFMQQAMLHKKIKIVDKECDLPNGFKISSSVKQDWDAFNHILLWQTHPHSESYILNPTTFGKFLKCYQYDDMEKSLTHIPGIIKHNQNKTINIVLTRNLNASQWTRLLAKCVKHKVTLNIVPSQDLALPNELHTPEKSASYLANKAHPQTQLIETNDLDYSIVKICQDEPRVKVMEISEVESEWLMNTFSLKQVEDVRLYFKCHYGALWTALENTEHVVLKGHFSQELIDRLAPLCLPNIMGFPHEVPFPFNGRLTLVSDNMDGFKKFLDESIVHKHYFSLSEKCEWFSTDQFNRQFLNDFMAKKGAKENYSFIYLDTLISFARKQFSHTNIQWGQDPWYGLAELTQSMLAVDFDLKSKAYRDFEKNRLEQIEITLAYSPYVFIAGLTGVGKSTFIEKAIGKNDRYTLYRSVAQLQAWANDPDKEKCKVLFVDEANLDQTDFSIFEGLYHHSPGILINGIYYSLDEKHKVIFAGNPLSYGAGRRLASLFKRHANVVVFSPLSAAYIYNEILYPLLGESITDACKEAISNHFINIYQRICTYSTNSVLLSPRELEMMAMLTLIKIKEARSESAASFHAIYNGYHIAKNVVPPKNRSDFDEWFVQQFDYLPTSSSEKLNICIALEADKIGDFVITPSRREAFNLLCDILDIRQYQKVYAENKLQTRAGLGGMVIEGEPGDGKSHFVNAVLTFRGFKQVEPHEIASHVGDIFCYISASMPSEEKKKTLISAFHAGAVLVMNEINSCSFHEKLLNSLLMGLDENGQPAKCPGFKIIGTCNPATKFLGRRLMSTAIKRRIVSCDYPAYSVDEMRYILRDRFHLREDILDQLINDFVQACRYADKYNIATKPTFRLLCSLCEEQKNQACASSTLSMSSEGKIWAEFSTFLASENGDFEEFEELNDAQENTNPFRFFKNSTQDALTKKRNRENEYEDTISPAKRRR